MELEFEAVKKVKLGEEHRWTTSIEGDERSGESRTRRKSWTEKKANVKGTWKKEVMWTPLVGQFVKLSRNYSCSFFLLYIRKKDVRLWEFLVCLAFLWHAQNLLCRVLCVETLVSRLSLLCLALWWLLVMLTCALMSYERESVEQGLGFSVRNQRSLFLVSTLS